jgi:nitroreductase
MTLHTVAELQSPGIDDKTPSLLQAIKARRSIRRFRAEAVPIEAIEQLLEAARWAPTPANLQLRRFIVVEDAATIKELGAATMDQHYVAAAPLVIAVLANCSAAAVAVGAAGTSLAIQEAAAATQNILLLAPELGLGGCWVGLIHANRVSQILATELTPVALIVLGRPAEQPPTPIRLPVDQISTRAAASNKRSSLR